MLAFLAALSLGLASATAAQPVEEGVVLSPEDFETTVYFDYGRNDLGSAGVMLVEHIAAKALAAGYTRATVTGHTDRAGPEDENYQTGLERAEAVASVLVQSGFREDDITIKSAGETEPARKHVDERREPLNRRVVIEFSE
ncbi:OmpA family protein [Parvularcula lutaonensis]|nr:OmpA family protein [Parvularcula lutaonensis]